jgi:N6-adenosine-specific RNA methylase IME4
VSQAEAAETMNVSGAACSAPTRWCRKRARRSCRKATSSRQIAVSTAAKIAERPAEEQQAILAQLPRDEAGKLTPEAKKQVRAVAREVRAEDQEVKKQKRAKRERKLGAKILALPDVKAGLIISDFEWHFKVRSEETGMDRHASNHYVTAAEAHTPEAIVERQRERMSIAADDCIHLMWCPASFNAIALKVMELQGFTYVSQFAWIKPGIGTGFWVRDRHELLLIGVRGKIPCPAMGEQFDSAIEAPKGEHSEKPDFQYEIAEHYFPDAAEGRAQRAARARGLDSMGQRLMSWLESLINIAVGFGISLYRRQLCRRRRAPRPASRWRWAARPISPSTMTRRARDARGQPSRDEAPAADIWKSIRARSAAAGRSGCCGPRRTASTSPRPRAASRSRRSIRDLAWVVVHWANRSRRASSSWRTSRSSPPGGRSATTAGRARTARARPSSAGWANCAGSATRSNGASCAPATTARRPSASGCS